MSRGFAWVNRTVLGGMTVAAAAFPWFLLDAERLREHGKRAIAMLMSSIPAIAGTLHDVRGYDGPAAWAILLLQFVALGIGLWGVACAMVSRARKG